MIQPKFVSYTKHTHQLDPLIKHLYLHGNIPSNCTHLEAQMIEHPGKLNRVATFRYSNAFPINELINTKNLKNLNYKIQKNNVKFFMNNGITFTIPRCIIENYINPCTKKTVKSVLKPKQTTKFKSKSTTRKSTPKKK